MCWRSMLTLRVRLEWRLLFDTWCACCVLKRDHEIPSSADEVSLLSTSVGKSRNLFSLVWLCVFWVWCSLCVCSAARADILDEPCSCNEICAISDWSTVSTVAPRYAVWGHSSRRFLSCSSSASVASTRLLRRATLGSVRCCNAGNLLGNATDQSLRCWRLCVACTRSHFHGSGALHSIVW